MVAEEQPVQQALEDIVRARMRAEATGAGEHCYRITALPSAIAQTDDVIINDEYGCAYLLSDGEGDPLPLEPSEVDSLGMFYEASQSLSWHPLADLRRMIYGKRTPMPR